MNKNFKSELVSNHKTNVELLKSLPHGKAAERTSNRYTVVNTLDVLPSILDEGFYMEKLSGPYSSKVEPYKKHVMSFVNPDIKVNGDTYARILMSNSYDGLSALTVIAGLFRSACENRMVFGSIGNVTNISNKHLEGVTEAVEKIDEYLEAVPRIGEVITKYRDTSIDDELQAKLALEFACLRQEAIWGNRFDRNQFAVDTESMLAPERPQDKGDDAWMVFNRLQEKVINGGYQYRREGRDKFKKAKAIRNPNTEQKINSLLFPKMNEIIIPEYEVIS